MATPMTPDQFLAALRKWKVQVREYPGWRTRRRPQIWGPVYGLMVHHTGSDKGQGAGYDDFLFVDGRPDLPAPLCNVATDMDGDLHLGAYGRANHAGAGSQSVLAHVLAEDYPGYARELEPGPDGPIGNQYFYGNEVKYDGGQPMTAAQYRTAVLTAAAICDHHGWSALSVIGHREWTRRKPDPGHCDMAAFRLAVKAQLAAGPPGPPKPAPGPITGEDDMAMTDAQAASIDASLKAIAAAAAKQTELLTKMQGDQYLTAVRLDSLVNKQFPELRTDTEEIKSSAAAIAQNTEPSP